MNKKKLGLLPKILIAILLGIAVGSFSPNGLLLDLPLLADCLVIF